MMLRLPAAGKQDMDNGAFPWRISPVIMDSNYQNIGKSVTNQEMLHCLLNFRYSILS